MNTEDTLAAIAAEIQACQKCPLHAGRRLAVPGEGPPAADLLLVGEGPWFHEDQQGRPFVGAAGSFLEELLAGAGLRREQVFITNVVKCRPPGNRDPQPDELQACAGYLQRQIQALGPRVIVTLGRHSLNHFLPNAKISAVHGQARQAEGRLIVPMFHPAAALHNPVYRQPLIEDFRKLPALIAAGQQAGDKPPDEPEATQLSLF